MPLVACPECGAPTARAWLTKASNVIGDEIDITQVNGLRHPRRFRSRLEHQRWLKENGFRVKDTHVGDQGSDKSKFTQSAAIMDPQTLENARYLVTHRQMIDADEPDEPLHVTFTEGYLTTAEARTRRKLNDRREQIARQRAHA